MMKVIFILIALIACFTAITRATDVTDRMEFEKLYRCAQENSSCGGKLAVQAGKMHIGPKLGTLRMTNFPGNCGLMIKYFILQITGESILKMPDGNKFNFGQYNFTLTNDYQYFIYSKMINKDAEPCRLAGTVWSPDDGSTRQENIDKTNRLLRVKKY